MRTPSPARERMAEHHRARQPEREAELAHLVLEQLAQRLEQLQVQRLGQPPTLWCDLMFCAFLVFAPPDSITSG
jgi:hypothetical protein